ncbi:MAG TPA: endonuclease III [Ignisphaera sp.]|uniref:Endonuclease III n=1 Tax=Ignisphaera aggregans TaxID=334771 RepID=A0A832YYM6_9CREN|nr:endonuclease III [Ignisphaera sp.]HIP56537.1 endonuclease III [Ignisphaera aggregans]
MVCTWNREKVLDLFNRLRGRYVVREDEFIALKLITSKGELFEVLVGIVLSQNTSERNAIRAFDNLKKVVKSVTPEALLRLSDEELQRAIAPAGLHRRRAIMLKKLASIFLVQGSCIIEKISELDVEAARQLLLKLPGIGPKTADVVLLMYFNKPTFPVDTNIDRVSRRLGIVSSDARYEDIRRRFLELLGRETSVLRLMHLLLIQHGRETCKARKPLCDRCVVSDLCCSFAKD